MQHDIDVIDSSEVIEEERVQVAEPKVKRPPMFKVVLLNDDYTPMDFVVEVLMYFFRKSEADATHIMLQIHSAGAAICGVYSRDVAETKANQVLAYANRNGHPLQCVVEKN